MNEQNIRAMLHGLLSRIYYKNSSLQKQCQALITATVPLAQHLQGKRADMRNLLQKAKLLLCADSSPGLRFSLSNTTILPKETCVSATL